MIPIKHLFPIAVEDAFQQQVLSVVDSDFGASFGAKPWHKVPVSLEMVGSNKQFGRVVPGHSKVCSVVVDDFKQQVLTIVRTDFGKKQLGRLRSINQSVVVVGQPLPFPCTWLTLRLSGAPASRRSVK